jgi:hypothetical protein
MRAELGGPGRVHASRVTPASRLDVGALRLHLHTQMGGIAAEYWIIMK